MRVTGEPAFDLHLTSAILKVHGHIALSMSFRDHAERATVVDVETSVNHGFMEESNRTRHIPLIFTNIPEAPGHRAIMNILTRAQLCEHWGLTPGELIDTLGWAMENPIEPFLVTKEEAECFQNTMITPDLSVIPIPWHYPEDRGRYMSASVIVAERGPDRNMSYHRQFLSGPNRLVARLVPRHLRQLTDEARADEEELRVAIINGADPCVLLCAAMSFDERKDELSVAAALHQKLYGKPLRVVEVSNGVLVPADCEYVFTAKITNQDDEEGPYVDITGTVDDIRMQPVIHVESVHHRDNPIFHAILPAAKEHKTLMGLPRAPTIKAAVSKVTNCTDVHLSEGGCGWLSSVVAITPSSEEDAQMAIQAALDGHRSMKSVTVVDDDIRIDDPVHVEWAMMTRWQPDRDTTILSSQKGSSLDPSRSEDGTTSKVGFDATIPYGEDREPYSAVN